MQKNITLAPELFDELSEQAQVEGKTTDELVEEAARKLLQTRRDVGRLRSFVSDNRREAAARGLKPSDVPARIAEYRSEHRGR